ncbi:hypothetical protein Q763_16425 [Flavobacterium beibuense F44-8]|uniref:Uncharacterized protein n=1 Tax=Flavobacterium beibuense F44-8 TaxID=1406840 RepID=A0A0A2LI50_9FLAO|nr:hypothetical protein [Flavobacterium beibuense]KGO78868.1 hypothetical protein Q763_16425 [Flavobacterium beibuense F44-8]
MKRFQLFILVLLSSSIIGYPCGYYPYGEQVRMCFFKPEYQDYNYYSPFFYTSQYYNDVEAKIDAGDGSNDIFWYNYCNGKVPMPAVTECVYSLPANDLDKASFNGMVQYLITTNDTVALNYLRFAKQCEPANGWYDDPWERDVENLVKQRGTLITKAIEYSKASGKEEFKRRYAFLAIRLDYYNGNYDILRSLYKEVFSQSENKDIIYYWATHFYTLTIEDKVEAAYYAAQVFANAPDKSFAVYRSFDKNLPIDEILHFAQNDKEKANIYVLAAIRKPGRALDYIKKAYKLDPNSEVMELLMLREVNKLEDWIHTPYYTLFTPTVTTESYPDSTEEVMMKRVEEDRQYAREVLSFVKSMKKTEDVYWLQVKANLELLAQQYKECVQTISKLDKKDINKVEAKNQIEKIYALALTAFQEKGKAVIPEKVKILLLKFKDDQRFVFAIGRELEYKGNTTDAALMYCNLVSEFYKEGNRWSDVYWKDGKKIGNYYDYFNDWFTYIDFNYTPPQIEQLIENIQNNKATDEFSNWKYSWITTKQSVLYDLLGTKYIRSNKLEEAAAAYEKAGNKYWEDNYGFWERKSFFNSGNQFDANPFYTLKYTPEFIPMRDTIKVNKYTVTKQLINYLAKAEDKNEKDRDYYYFLVANCYYNMTDYGNSWMMRRYYKSYDNIKGFQDDEEYYDCVLAKKYYHKAFEHAKTDKFKALCLRLIASCNQNKDDKELLEFATSKEMYDDLTSNCTRFSDYFKARR